MGVVAALVAFFFGASIGSFLNLTADRLPLGQSLWRPPSHCPVCGRRLTPLELVPVFSYLWLRGRCYRCRALIPPRVLVVELSLGLLAALLWWGWGASPASLFLFIYAALFLLLAVIDQEQGIIPDVLVYPGAGLGLVLSPFWSRLGLEREFLGSAAPGYLLLGSLSGAALVVGVFLVPILVYPGSMGWGDVKMAAAIGLVSGFPGVVVAMMVSFITGGLVAALMLALHQRSRKQTIPFAPFLALGAWVALPWGGELLQWYWRLFF